MVTILLLFLTLLYLFCRECRKDAMRNLKQNYMDDLHMLKEFKKYYDQRGLDSSKFENEIKELEDKLDKF